jgi:hypothetical protein
MYFFLSIGMLNAFIMAGHDVESLKNTAVQDIKEYFDGTLR